MIHELKQHVNVTMMSDVLKVLELSRDKIVNVGWTQRTWYRDADGNSLPQSNRSMRSKIACYCLSAAISDSAEEVDFENQHMLFCHARDIVEKVIRTFHVSWNDAPHRVKEDVINALDKSIEHTNRT